MIKRKRVKNWKKEAVILLGVLEKQEKKEECGEMKTEEERNIKTSGQLTMLTLYDYSYILCV